MRVLEARNFHRTLPKAIVAFSGLWIYGYLEGDRLTFFAMLSLGLFALGLKLIGKFELKRTRIEFSMASLGCVLAFAIGGYPESFQTLNRMGPFAAAAVLLLALYTINASLNRLRFIAAPLACLMFASFLHLKDPYLTHAFDSELEAWTLFLLAWELLSSFLFSRKGSPTIVDTGAALSLAFIYYAKSADFVLTLGLGILLLAAYLASHFQGSPLARRLLPNGNRHQSRARVTRGDRARSFVSSLSFLAIVAVTLLAALVSPRIPVLESLEPRPVRYQATPRPNALAALSYDEATAASASDSEASNQSAPTSLPEASPSPSDRPASEDGSPPEKRSVTVRIVSQSEEAASSGFNGPTNESPPETYRMTRIASGPSIRVAPPSVSQSLPLPSYTISGSEPNDDASEPLENSVDFSLDGFDSASEEGLFSPERAPPESPLSVSSFQNGSPPLPARRQTNNRNDPAPTPVGIANTVQFTDAVNARFEDTPLFEVYVPEGLTPPRALYLRIDALERLGARQFSNIPTNRERRFESLEPGWNPAPESMRSERPSEALWTIAVAGRWRSALPLPGPFQSIRLPADFSARVDPQRFSIENPYIEGPFAFQIAGLDPRSDWRQIEPVPERLGALVDLPLNRAEIAYLTKLSDRIAKRNTSVEAFARSAVAYLGRNHAYRSEFSIRPGKDHVLVRWLKTRSPGICGYYAGAFTLLARAQGIPARVVTGAVSAEYRGGERKFIVRSRNAHAWAEALDENNRWIQVDPTPIAADDIRFEPSLRSSDAFARNISDALEQLGNSPLEATAAGAEDFVPPASNVALGSEDNRINQGERLEIPSALALLDRVAAQLESEGEGVSSAVPDTVEATVEDLPARPDPLPAAADLVAKKTLAEDLSPAPSDREEAVAPPLATEPSTAYGSERRPFRFSLPHAMIAIAILFVALQLFRVLSHPIQRRSESRTDSGKRRIYSRLDRLLLEIEGRIPSTDALGRIDWVALHDEAIRLRYGPECEPSEIRGLGKRLKALARKKP